MRVPSLNQEGPPEKEMATHSSIDRNILRTEEPGGSIGSGRVGHNWVTEHAHRRKELWRVRGAHDRCEPKELWRARARGPRLL